MITALALFPFSYISNSSSHINYGKMLLLFFSILSNKMIINSSFTDIRINEIIFKKIIYWRNASRWFYQWNGKFLKIYLEIEKKHLRLKKNNIRLLYLFLIWFDLIIICCFCILRRKKTPFYSYRCYQNLNKQFRSMINWKLVNQKVFNGFYEICLNKLENTWAINMTL